MHGPRDQPQAVECETAYRRRGQLWNRLICQRSTDIGNVYGCAAPERGVEYLDLRAVHLEDQRHDRRAQAVQALEAALTLRF